MTVPERLSDTAPWRDWFEQAMNSGAPIVDNASTRLYSLGELEGDRCDCGTAIPGDVDTCDDCAAEDDDSCGECGREDSAPRCFDCDVRSSYVGGLAPRFGAQP